jgi:dipeptidyl-peptidase 4
MLLCASTLILVFVSVPPLTAQNGTGAARSAITPNYDLAAQWTSQKVARLVFATSVTPRWLETGDRFWYSYQTREGRRFYLVDPLKKAKVPLFDHAK